MEKRTEKAIDDYEIKENIAYKWLLNDRLMVLNSSFDSTDTSRIKSALMTTFTMLTPYINCRFRKCRCKKKIRELANIHDKEKFIAAAHEIYAMLLKIMHEHSMLLTEIDITLG